MSDVAPGTETPSSVPPGPPPPESPAGNPGGARTVLVKGTPVPWPRRLISAGLFSAVIALALHALPRPYQPLATTSVIGLGDAYSDTRADYRNAVASLEPITGEAPPEARKGYARELWRYRWLGTFREVVLRLAEWLAATCVFGALALVVVERRRVNRELARGGVRLAPAVLRHETLSGAELPIPPSTSQAFSPPPVIPPRPASLREAGEEITPPSPMPIPRPASLDLRPVTRPDDEDDFERDDGSAPNLAKRPLTSETKRARHTSTGPALLPQFFLQRRHPDPHPIVHPGDREPPEDGAPAPKDEARVAAKEEPKPATVEPSKQEAKVETKAEATEESPKSEAKAEPPKSEAKVEAKAEATEEPKAEAKAETNGESPNAEAPRSEPAPASSATPATPATLSDFTAAVGSGSAADAPKKDDDAKKDEKPPESGGTPSA